MRHCATCDCESTEIPAPATSSAWSRRQALEATEQAVSRARERRTTVNRPHDEETA